MSCNKHQRQDTERKERKIVTAAEEREEERVRKKR